MKGRYSRLGSRSGNLESIQCSSATEIIIIVIIAIAVVIIIIITAIAIIRSSLYRSDVTMIIMAWQ